VEKGGEGGCLPNKWKARIRKIPIPNPHLSEEEDCNAVSPRKARREILEERSGLIPGGGKRVFSFIQGEGGESLPNVTSFAAKGEKEVIACNGETWKIKSHAFREEARSKKKKKRKKKQKKKKKKKQRPAREKRTSFSPTKDGTGEFWTCQKINRCNGTGRNFLPSMTGGEKKSALL